MPMRRSNARRFRVHRPLFRRSLAAAALAPAALAAVLLAAGPSAAASFDCATNRAPDEVAICNSCDLAQLDVKLSTLYGMLTKLVGMGQRGMIRDDQRAWLQQRASCGGNASCIADAYRARIGALEKAMDDIASRGPF